jgi:hypothetical protein
MFSETISVKMLAPHFLTFKLQSPEENYAECKTLFYTEERGHYCWERKKDSQFKNGKLLVELQKAS